MHELIVVPNLHGYERYQELRGCGFMILDDLITHGQAGVVFRRLQLLAVVDTTARNMYDQLRSHYLARVLPMILQGNTDCIIVGVSPADADLIEFGRVHTLDLDLRELMSLSSEIYGEEIMLATEYSLVTSLLLDSVDVVHTVERWADVPTRLLKFLGGIPAVHYAGVPDTLARQVLRTMTIQAGITTTYVDRNDYFSDDQCGDKLMDCDYVACIGAMWRDAVVTVLGVAPSIEDVWRLPWYMADSTVVYDLCYYPDSHGIMAATMHGESLVNFVRQRLSCVMAPEEMVGTWLGALLRGTAYMVQVDRVLRGTAIQPASNALFEARRSDSPMRGSAVVEKCRAWMYAATSDVDIVPDGTIIDAASAPVALPVEEHLKPWHDDLTARTHVAAFTRRIQSLGKDSASFVTMLKSLLEKIESGVSTDMSDGEAAMLALLPGCNYLGCFPRHTRRDAFDALSQFPLMSRCVSHAAVLRADGVVADDVLTKLWDRAKRSAIINGLPYADHELLDLPVGALDQAGDGYCYSVLFAPRYRRAMVSVLGKYPSMGVVSGAMVACASWLDAADYSVSLRLLRGRWVLHLALAALIAGQPGMVSASGYTYVGRDVVADSTQNHWFLPAVISITINLCFFLTGIGVLVYRCLRRPRNLGRRR